MNLHPFSIHGTVYGTLLNFRREHALWAPRMHEAPYKAPPQAPVLYIKTANTFTPAGRPIALPGDVHEVEVAASLGLVAGEGGCIAAAVLLNDVAIAHESYYRPPVKYRCVDGFLGVGDSVRALDDTAALAALVLELRVNGVMRQHTALADLVRDAATLWADVNAFQSLRPGDVLMVGTDCLADGSRPRAKAGDSVEITATGFSPLVNHFVQEPPDAGPPPVGRAPERGSQHAPAPSVGVTSS
ncbi:MAG: fumarylacetoacetate hydrolase family protein [Hydrogenophaga sp.]|nr:fumarylacetoacetate hydrolase family protein [Hydrogenophaga sp.]